MNWLLQVSLTLCAFALTSCGGTEGARPHDMSAAGHRAEAVVHDERADDEEAQYDPNASRSRSCPSASGPGGAGIEATCFDEVYNPTESHRRRAEEHREHANDHAGAAQVLEGFEEGQCGHFGAEVRGSCPLLGAVTGTEDIEGGARIQFAEGTNLEAVFAHMECHLAFAQTQGREGMPHCPLYVEGAHVQRVDQSIDLTVVDTEGVPALRERIRRHVGVE